MKTLLGGILFLMLAPVFCFGAEPDEEYEAITQRYVEEAVKREAESKLPSKFDIASTARVAIGIHEVVYESIYGKQSLAEQKPFKAIRSGRFWIVYGLSSEPHLGGTVVTVIRASDGAVLLVAPEQ